MNSTPCLFLTSVYYVLLQMHSGARDIAIGTDVANRDARDHAGLIGFFSNQLVLRVRGAEARTFRDVCQQTRACVEDAFAHKDLPYDVLVRAIRGEAPDAARESLFRAKFVFHHQLPDIGIDGIRTSFVDVKPRMAKFDLLLNVEEGDGRLLANIEYSGAIFDEPAVTRLAAHFTDLCTRVTLDVDVPLEALISSVSQGDRDRAQSDLDQMKAARRRELRRFLQSQPH
jgi:non-ribosomal peptide synthetase component F